MEVLFPNGCFRIYILNISMALGPCFGHHFSDLLDICGERFARKCDRSDPTILARWELLEYH